MNQHAAAGAILGLALSTPLAHAQLPCPPEQTQQIPAPLCDEFQTFGRRISLVGQFMAEGHYEASGGQIRTYVLGSSHTWDVDGVLQPNDLDPFDGFGHFIALYHNSAINEVLIAGGSPSKSNLEPSAGKAYVFRRDGPGRWSQTAEVLPETLVAHGWFGRAVGWATVGERVFLVVGAPGSDAHQIVGSTYVFEQDDQGAWTQKAHLQAPNGSPEDAFGRSIASAESAGVTVLGVGSPGKVYVAEAQSGAVYFFRHEGPSDEWVLEARFQAQEPYDQDLFGHDVAVSAVVDEPGITHRAVVGCPHEGNFGSDTGPGATYVYDRHEDGTWSRSARLVAAPFGAGNIRLGWAVDLDRDNPNRFVAGAPSDSRHEPGSGAAFVFERDEATGSWTTVRGVFGTDSNGRDLFGAEVALGNAESTDIAVIGAEQWNCPEREDRDTVGAVYSFDLDPGEGNECPPPMIRLQKVPDCSGGPGGELEVRWFQATPDRSARIAILYARRTGSFNIPSGNPCAGLPLGLGSQQLQVAFVGSAGQFGAGRLKTNIPRTACGGYLQLLDVSRCELSNVVRIE